MVSPQLACHLVCQVSPPSSTLTIWNESDFLTYLHLFHHLLQCVVRMPSIDLVGRSGTGSSRPFLRTCTLSSYEFAHVRGMVIGSPRYPRVQGSVWRM